MPTLDPRVDAYIAKAPAFAQPILTRLRDAVHSACPDVVETIKWSVPSFEYKGPFCGMASFKKHAMFGFWKHQLMQDVLPKGEHRAFGRFGRLESIDDVPSKAALVKIVRIARKLNDDGVKVSRTAKTAKPPVKTPADLMAALKKSPRALAAFKAFSPSHSTSAGGMDHAGADTRRRWPRRLSGSRRGSRGTGSTRGNGGDGELRRVGSGVPVTVRRTSLRPLQSAHASQAGHLLCLLRFPRLQHRTAWPFSDQVAKDVNAVADTYLRGYLDAFPENALAIGARDPHPSQLGDHSLAALKKWEQHEDELLARLKQIDIKPIQNDPEAVTYQDLQHLLEAAQGFHVCKNELWNVSPT